MGKTTMARTKGLKIYYPVAIGDDVVAWNIYGTDGWSRLMRVDPDGSTVPLRAVPQRHMGPFRGGAGWCAWLESFGDLNFNRFDQPEAELWAAPYTTDPGTLAKTAKKLADLKGVHTTQPEPVYEDGYFAAEGDLGDGKRKVLHVVRVSDGAHKKLDLDAILGPGADRPYYLQALVSVSATEVMGTLGYVGGPGFGIVRVPLGPWP